MSVKRKYNVFLVEKRDYNGIGEDERTKSFAGETWAVSEAQAENNVAYRHGMRPHGFKDMWGDGLMTWDFVAELAYQERGERI